MAHSDGDLRYFLPFDSAGRLFFGSSALGQIGIIRVTVIKSINEPRMGCGSAEKNAVLGTHANPTEDYFVSA